MSSVNRVAILGHLGADPDARDLANGGRVVNLRVATSESWKDKNGERQERTEWHSVVIWNEHLADVAERYLRKGSKVYVEGQLQTRKWTDKDGQDRYTTEIVLQRFRGELVLLDKREDGEAATKRAASSTAARKPARATYDNWPDRGGLDDDIPL